MSTNETDVAAPKDEPHDRIVLVDEQGRQIVDGQGRPLVVNTPTFVEKQEI
jgi:hypothetical protein